MRESVDRIDRDRSRGDRRERELRCRSPCARSRRRSTYARSRGADATSGHDVSSAYGLRARTRTAALNAAILPKMVRTARVTAAAVERAAIPAPLMVMRSDGGVMDVREIERRPILTLLSGPAAGIAGALFYERLSEGIFVEVGARAPTVRRYARAVRRCSAARIGGHRTMLRTLDVRTLGIGGGQHAARSTITRCSTSGRAARTSPAVRMPRSFRLEALAGHPSRPDRTDAARPRRVCGVDRARRPTVRAYSDVRRKRVGNGPGWCVCAWKCRSRAARLRIARATARRRCGSLARTRARDRRRQTARRDRPIEREITRSIPRASRSSAAAAAPERLYRRWASSCRFHIASLVTPR